MSWHKFIHQVQDIINTKKKSPNSRLCRPLDHWQKNFIRKSRIQIIIISKWINFFKITCDTFHLRRQSERKNLNRIMKVFSYFLSVLHFFFNISIILRDLTEILYMANYHKHHFTCFVNFVLNSLETIIN